MKLLDQILDYLAKGLHPIPCEARGKTPLVQWQAFQEKAPTAELVREWWQQWPNANVGLVVGRGLVVVDLDGPDAQNLLHEAGIVMPAGAPRVRTGNGQHIYLRLPPGVTARNRAGFLSSTVGGTKSQIDLRADGGFVVAPPSIHASGRAYEWLVPMQAFNDIPLVPDALLRFRTAPDTAPKSDGTAGPGWVSEALRGVGEGRRDDTATRLAGYFLGKGMPEDVVVTLLEQFAQRCTPPLTMRDVLRIVTSVARAEARNPKEQTEQPREVVVEHISVSVQKALEEMQAPKRGISTPFGPVNMWITGGFMPGELIYLGASPGTGKTAFALELARHAAKLGKNTLVVSREMLSASLARRMIAQEGQLNATDLKLGREIPAACRTGEKLSTLPLWITDSARTIDEVRTAINSAPNGVDFLLVDYLQLVSAPREVRDRRLQVEYVSKELKSLALSMQIPIFCLSSLSRPTSGTNPRPTLARLRETGELEFDADVVMFLHRESNDSLETLCIVEKNRDGGLGTSSLVFKAEWLSFKEAGYYE